MHGLQKIFFIIFSRDKQIYVWLLFLSYYPYFIDCLLPPEDRIFCASFEMRRSLHWLFLFAKDRSYTIIKTALIQKWKKISCLLWLWRLTDSESIVFGYIYVCIFLLRICLCLAQYNLDPITPYHWLLPIFYKILLLFHNCKFPGNKIQSISFRQRIYSFSIFTSNLI